MFKYLLPLIVLSLFSCKKTERGYTYDNIDFKEEMRDFVIHIGDYARSVNSGFIVIPQNGVELLTVNGEVDAGIHQEYMEAINGQSQEDLFFGYNTNDILTPASVTEYLKQFLNKVKAAGKTVLITDYCSSQDHIIMSRDSIAANGYIGFTATHRELDVIPQLPVPNENSNDIDTLTQAGNYLYLINYQNFTHKQHLLQSIAATNYDVVIMDLFYQNQSLTSQDLSQIRYKSNGGKRLLIAYVSIGEAEDYRYYWQSQWLNDQPIWLDEENQDWPGNYKVRYWEKDWQKIIYGNSNSYIKKVIDAGFDGCFLDVVDAYEFFEEKTQGN